MITNFPQDPDDLARELVRNLAQEAASRKLQEQDNDASFQLDRLRKIVESYITALNKAGILFPCRAIRYDGSEYTDPLTSYLEREGGLLVGDIYFVTPDKMYDIDDDGARFFVYDGDVDSYLQIELGKEELSKGIYLSFQNPEVDAREHKKNDLFEKASRAATPNKAIVTLNEILNKYANCEILATKRYLEIAYI